MGTFLERLLRYSLGGGLPVMIIAVALVVGALALHLTPREEEPQIVVPIVEVMVQAPGLSAKQVERQVTTPLEKLLVQIPGVEHTYSSSATGSAVVTLRFFVGRDREEAILETYNKLYSNLNKIPVVVSNWFVHPVEVDDVPIMLLGLWSDDASRYSDFELRRLADDVSTYLQRIPQTSEVTVVGGRPRKIQILIDPESLSARRTTAAEIVSALRLSNTLTQAGDWIFNDRSIVLESGDVVRTIEELNQLVVSVIDGEPIYLRDVATIEDGPQERESYSWIDFAPGHPQYRADTQSSPLVTIAVAKQRGSNAVNVAEAVHRQLAEFKQQLLPTEIHVEVIRDYGATANEKVNNLVESLAFAVVTVVIFIGVFLGWRSALVVAMAVPVCYGVTLALDAMFGYTINRVTLFALILSLGLLVDDPITGVDNISRYLTRAQGSIKDRISAAIIEIRVPLLMSTLTIVLAFLPLAYLTGMMGPYMAPMAFNVPVSVITSTVVAFAVTPWLAFKLLKSSPATAEDISGEGFRRVYHRLLSPLLASRRKAKVVLWLVAVLFIVAMIFPLLRLVPLKLLPFDNRNEFQVVIDLPEGSSLERTAAVAREVSTLIARLREVQSISAYVGQPSPIDFNGLARQYYHRVGSHLADLRVTLVDKTERDHQSHAVILRLRQQLEPLNRDGIHVKVVEVPPGPPVMSTLVAEVYGEPFVDYGLQQQGAELVAQRLRREAQVVDVDTTVEAPRQRLRFITDKAKAAISGVSTEDINNTLLMANHGYAAGVMQLPREAVPLPIELRLAADQRSSINDFERLQVKGRAGVVKTSSTQGLDVAPQPLVALGELGHFEAGTTDQTIHHKDLRPVVYVTAEVSGRPPAAVIADVAADLGADAGSANNWRLRTYLTNGGGDGWQLPDGLSVNWSGEGELKITLDVFRDLGLAFGFALIAIFFVLRVQTASTSLSLIIMSAIPLTFVGIMPGFWLLNQLGEREVAGAPDPVLFTATAMIGMIALAGIVIRNSLILVEFIGQARAAGATIQEALLEAGAVRMRPVLLTAGTTLLGNLVITLDPVFNGLALAIIFGIIASTLFTLVVVPLVYLLIFDRPDDPAHNRNQS